MIEIIKYKWRQLFCLHRFEMISGRTITKYEEGYTTRKINKYNLRCTECGKVKKNMDERETYFLIAEGVARKNEDIPNE